MHCGGCTCRGVCTYRGSISAQEGGVPAQGVYLTRVVYLPRGGGCTCWERVPTQGVYLPGVRGVPAQMGVYLPRGGCTCLGVCVPAWGVYLPREGTCPGNPPPVNRITDTCKNITLSQTSFAGGNNVLDETD